MKKGLIFGLIAVLSAAFLVIGCSQSTDSDGSTSIQIGGRLVDIEVTTEAALYAALASPDYQIIGVTGPTGILLATSVAPYDVTEIPAGKTVVLYTSLTPPGLPDVLTINGTLIVEGSGVLNGAHGTNEVEVDKGHIEVINGTISVDVPEAVHGVPVTQEIFGTGKVQFAGGNLDISTHLTTLEKVKTVFGWVPQGTVTIDGVDEEIKPSVLADAIRAFPSTATRRLIISDTVPFVAPGDTVTELVIPAGLSFTTADPFPSLTTLDVKGDLDATVAAFTGVTDLTVSGSLTAGNATYNNLKELTVESPLVISTALPALEVLEVKAGGAFSGLAIGGPTPANEGLAITVAPKGAAAVTTITNLKSATIQGALTAASFTYDTTGSAPSPLSVAADGSINGITFPSQTLIPKLDGVNGVVIDDYTVPGGLTLTIPAAKTLTVAAGETLTYNGPVAIEPTGKLVLTTGATATKIAGIGIIKAGATTITGDWETTGAADGTLTILSTEVSSEAVGATITALTGATGLKASAANAGITQAAGVTGNSLTIAADTKIELNSVAKITLVAALAAGNPGTLTLADADAVIQTVATGAPGTALTAAKGIFVLTAAAADGKAACSAISATTGINIVPVSGTDVLYQITGGSASHTIKATATSVNGGNIVLDKDTPAGP
jgi:hypothetical protein